MKLKFDPKIEFEKHYEQYLESIFRFSYVKTSSKFEAEEITAEVFAKYWKELCKGRIIINPRAYLYQCARHCVIDFYRQRGKVQIVDIDKVAEPVSPENLTIQAQTHENMEQIVSAMSGLKDEYQSLILWYYVDGLTIPEIARHLNKSEGSIRTGLSRAMEQVRQRVLKA